MLAQPMVDGAGSKLRVERGGKPGKGPRASESAESRPIRFQRIPLRGPGRAGRRDDTERCRRPGSNGAGLVDALPVGADYQPTICRDGGGAKVYGEVTSIGGRSNDRTWKKAARRRQDRQFAQAKRLEAGGPRPQG